MNVHTPLPTHMARRLAAIALALALVVWLLTATMTARKALTPPSNLTATPGAPPPGPCGTRTTPPTRYDHVVWILMENHSYNEIIGNSAAPYINRLALQCGLATNYFAVSHPSLPNYIALTSGATQGITDDDGPSSHRLNVPSIFKQLPAGGSRSLEESMSPNCHRSDSGEYAVRHDPEAYFTNLGTECTAYDMPYTAFGAPDISAKFTFVTPNVNDDMHDGTIKQGNAWLSKFVPLITGSATYAAGKTAIVITWDENDGAQHNQVATIVIAPSVRPGTKSAIRFSHYSLLRTTEEQLGLPLLGHAESATSMRRAFNY